MGWPRSAKTCVAGFFLFPTLQFFGFLLTQVWIDPGQKIPEHGTGALRGAHGAGRPPRGKGASTPWSSEVEHPVSRRAAGPAPPAPGSLCCAAPERGGERGRKGFAPPTCPFASAPLRACARLCGAPPRASAVRSRAPLRPHAPLRAPLRACARLLCASLCAAARVSSVRICAPLRASAARVLRACARLRACSPTGLCEPLGASARVLRSPLHASSAPLRATVRAQAAPRLHSRLRWPLRLPLRACLRAFPRRVSSARLRARLWGAAGGRGGQRPWRGRSLQRRPKLAADRRAHRGRGSPPGWWA